MAATRNEKHIRSASQVLYLALELGVEEWKLAFIPDLEAKPRVRTMPARDLKRLVKEVATAMRWSGLPDSTRVRGCYEAGRDDFGCIATWRPSGSIIGSSTPAASK